MLFSTSVTPLSMECFSRHPSPCRHLYHSFLKLFVVCYCCPLIQVGFDKFLFNFEGAWAVTGYSKRNVTLAWLPSPPTNLTNWTNSPGEQLSHVDTTGLVFVRPIGASPPPCHVELLRGRGHAIPMPFSQGQRRLHQSFQDGQRPPGLRGGACTTFDPL